MPIIRFGDGFTLDADLHAWTGACTSLPVDADLQLPPSIPFAQPEDHFRVERQHQGPETQTSGTDRGDEQRSDQRMDDGATCAERIRRGACGRTNEDTVANGLG